MSQTHSFNRIMGLMAVAGLAAMASAQDSVSTFGTPTPGDALDPYTSAAAVNYTVEMTPLTTSWGNVFGIAPLMKSQRANLTFNNNLISAQGISQDTVMAGSLAGTMFADWSPSDTFGSGINPSANATPGMVAGPAQSFQIGAGFTGFGTTDFGTNSSNINAAVINYLPTSSTLYVRRATAATNGVSASDTGFAALAFGSIDATGNTFIRADNFGTASGSLPAITGNNILRVASTGITSLNTISGAGATDAAATDFIISGSSDTITTPTNVPASAAGDTDGQFMSPAFGGTLRFGDVGSVTTDTTYRTGTSDTRGTVSWSPAIHFPGTVGTGAIIGRSNAGGGDDDSFQVWGTLASGQPSGTCTLVAPAVILDPTTSLPVTLGQFSNYGSQIPFNGGNGLIATGSDVNGNNLAAGVNYLDSGAGRIDNDPSNAIVVARYNDQCEVEWSIAATVTAAGGSPIFDGTGAQIGQLVGLPLLTGGNPFGPSLSPPAFDAYGNVYFTGPAMFTDSDDMFDSALFRGVYDPATFSYRLEVMFRTGDVFDGGDSGVQYQIGFLGVADNNSLSSGAFFSGNANQNAWGGASTDGAQDPRNLGGLVVNTSITYDVDGDGIFDDNAAGSQDEQYSALLFIGNLGAEEECVADFNGDNNVNILDVIAFITAWQGGLDFNMDGNVNILDVIAFITVWNMGCP